MAHIPPVARPHQEHEEDLVPTPAEDAVVSDPDPAEASSTPLQGLRSPGARVLTEGIHSPGHPPTRFRGGSWSSVIANLRCAYRLDFDPTLRLATTGYRCARSL